jgi:quercetin dioxygenase-like cupin family protein
MLDGEMELVFDDETIILRPGDTITVPPNVWHEALCKEGGKMLTLFKNGRFDVFLEKLSKMTEADFANPELMKSVSNEFDIYED